MPDRKIVAVLSQKGESRIVAVDGRGVEEMSLPPVDDCPVVLRRGLETIDMAFIAKAPDAMPAICLASGNQNLTSKVIRVAGPELIDKDYISVGEAIAFQTADGEDAHAFYYPPVNAGFRPLDGEKPPLIVMLHGGPTSSAATGFSPKVQWWTTRGFAVADINYRGSTGYGRDYRQKLDGNWGKADVEDCIAAVNHLVKIGKADPERIAIRGGSAGGFTVLAALTSSDIFKAGASHYGIGDLLLLAEETHKFESRYMDRLIGPLPQAAEIYRDRSPINHLDRLTAGTIFFQGLDDKVVPPSQARTMVEAMRARNLPVAHIEFPGEGHGFRRAENQRRVLELELSFYGQLFGFQPPDLSEKPEIHKAEAPPVAVFKTSTLMPS